MKRDWPEEMTRLENLVDQAAKAVKAVPGVGTGPMGLTPDEVKQSEAYRKAKAEYQRAFEALRTYNGNQNKKKGKA